jgi:hypothetical protein
MTLRDGGSMTPSPIFALFGKAGNKLILVTFYGDDLG